MAGNANDNLDWYLGTEETALSPLLIPELNQGFLGSCDGLDQYAKLFGLVYSTLENKTVGQGHQLFMESIQSLFNRTELSAPNSTPCCSSR